MYRKLEIEFAGRPLSLETGRLAKQSHGAVLAQYGDTIVLATVVSAYQSREKMDFLPLTVDYQERTFAAGKIPGGFFKREGRPSEKEILTSRLIDRAMRPLFPKGYDKETQIVVTVLSADRDNDPDMLSLIAASAALEVSDIPHNGPVAAVRMGRVGGKLIVNPRFAEMEASDLSMVVAAQLDSIVMLEGGAQIVDEESVLEALFSAHEEMRPVFELQQELRRLAGKTKRQFTLRQYDQALLSAVRERMAGSLEEALKIVGKKERNNAIYSLSDRVVAELASHFPERTNELTEATEKVLRDRVRGVILEQDRRIDDRSSTEIRPLSAQVQVLPRTHGSALFTRGETQVLATVTLGTSSDEQRVDALLGERFKKFMLHYNFPPFSTGEVKFLRGPSRREIGHGALAERALAPILPPEDSFPYTIRVVSEVLESNGSSSMATVCGGSLALFDAGVPMTAACAGIAMGLIKEGSRVAVLTDILGTEDHLGDMDFKVAGTRQGVTSIQMDIKIEGLDFRIISEALEKAKKARLHILDIMDQAIPKPRSQLSKYAPRIITMQIRPDKIGDLIGPKGKTIRGIQEQTGAEINVDDTGLVTISAVGEGGERARDMIAGLVQEPEVGKVYEGVVKSTTAFGAFVEITPGVEGLLHISELQHGRTERTEDVVKKGDHVRVKLLEVDERGRMRLSRKALLEKPEPARSH